MHSAANSNNLYKKSLSMQPITKFTKIPFNKNQIHTISDKLETKKNSTKKSGFTIKIMDTENS